MATLTEVAGAIYDSLGNLLTVGELTVTLQRDIISVDGTKVAPFAVSADLSITGGTFDKFIYATVGASPAGVYYLVEFDPDPDDTTKPAKQKDGYFTEKWAVTNTVYLGIGLFPHL